MVSCLSPPTAWPPGAGSGHQRSGHSGACDTNAVCFRPLGELWFQTIRASPFQPVMITGVEGTAHGEAAVSAAPTLDGTLHVPMTGLLPRGPRTRVHAGQAAWWTGAEQTPKSLTSVGFPHPRHALTAPFVLTALSLHTCFIFTITRLILLGGGECGVSFVY